MDDIIRICNKCKEKILLNTSQKDKVVHYCGKWYHLDCFINDCTFKVKRKNHDEKWDYAIENLAKIIKDTNDFLDEYEIKDQIYRHILSAYHLSNCPQYIFTKLNGVYKGTLKGIAQPIPPTHLLDMWKQKQKWLDKQAERKNSKGDNLVGMKRVVYDLAVLCGKYGDYKKWLEAETIKEIAERHEQKTVKTNIDYSKIKMQNITSGLDDINNLLDDLI